MSMLYICWLLFLKCILWAIFAIKAIFLFPIWSSYYLIWPYSIGLPTITRSSKKSLISNAESYAEAEKENVLSQERFQENEKLLSYLDKCSYSKPFSAKEIMRFRYRLMPGGHLIHCYIFSDSASSEDESKPSTSKKKGKKKDKKKKDKKTKLKSLERPEEQSPEPQNVSELQLPKPKMTKMGSLDISSVNSESPDRSNEEVFNNGRYKECLECFNKEPYREKQEKQSFISKVSGFATKTCRRFFRSGKKSAERESLIQFDEPEEIPPVSHRSASEPQAGPSRSISFPDTEPRRKSAPQYVSSRSDTRIVESATAQSQDPTDVDPKDQAISDESPSTASTTTPKNFSKVTKLVVLIWKSDKDAPHGAGADTMPIPEECESVLKMAPDTLEIEIEEPLLLEDETSRLEFLQKAIISHVTKSKSSEGSGGNQMSSEGLDTQMLEMKLISFEESSDTPDPKETSSAEIKLISSEESKEAKTEESKEAQTEESKKGKTEKSKKAKTEESKEAKIEESKEAKTEESKETSSAEIKLISTEKSSQTPISKEHSNAADSSINKKTEAKIDKTPEKSLSSEASSSTKSSSQSSSSCSTPKRKYEELKSEVSSSAEEMDDSSADAAEKETKDSLKKIKTENSPDHASIKPSKDLGTTAVEHEMVSDDSETMEETDSDSECALLKTRSKKK